MERAPAKTQSRSAPGQPGLQARTALAAARVSAAASPAPPRHPSWALFEAASRTKALLRLGAAPPAAPTAAPLQHQLLNGLAAVREVLARHGGDPETIAAVDARVEALRAEVYGTSAPSVEAAPEAAPSVSDAAPSPEASFNEHAAVDGDGVGRSSSGRAEVRAKAKAKVRGMRFERRAAASRAFRAREEAKAETAATAAFRARAERRAIRRQEKAEHRARKALRADKRARKAALRAARGVEEREEEDVETELLEEPGEEIAEQPGLEEVEEQAEEVNSSAETVQW